MLIQQLIDKDFSSEFTFSTSKSSGAGGQNVNKVNTKVELRFAVAKSELLTDEQKELVIEKLSGKLTNDGELIIVSQTERTQLGNKQKCIEKFYKIISKALTPRKKRKPTKPPKESIEKRIEQKRKISEKKEQRKKPNQ